MLKKVVLPAPLGPIRLTMERSGISKSTASTATSPPKILVIPRASSMLAPFSSGTGPAPYGVAARGATLVHLLRPLAVGDDPLRSQEHHRNQDDAKKEEVVLGEVDVAKGGASEGVAQGVDPLVDLGQEVEVEALQGDGAQDHTVDTPHPA